MITARLDGGLGNQMFMIATTYALALDNEDECGFRFFKRKHYITSSGRDANTYKATIYSKLKALSPEWVPEIRYDEPDTYKPIPYHKNMLLNGYLCWPQYFNHRRRDIIELFKNRGIIAGIQGKFENSVAMHIRRGNYIYLPTIHPILEKAYYVRALKYIESKAKVDVIYVFTENTVPKARDLEWCMKNLHHKKIVFVQGNPDYIDFYMMSMCTHHIIANSSFSWWSSYLCENENKIICSPKVWHGKAFDVLPSAFFCDNWILIDN